MQQCEKDGGELFSNFVRSWYTAVGHVSTETDHILPMLLLVMDIMKIDNLEYEPIVVLRSVLEEQVILFIYYQIMEERSPLGMDSAI